MAVVTETVHERMRKIEHALSRIWQTYFRDECAIHLEVQRVLSDAGFSWAHEVTLADRLGRIDFVCNRIGLEVKHGKPNSHRLRAQLDRYSNSAELDGLIIVCERSVFKCDRVIGGKPVSLICLSRNWGFAP